jgi:hypothetical protein
MNTLLIAAIRCALMFLVPALAYADSAQWDLDPISGDWNTLRHNHEECSKSRKRPPGNVLILFTSVVFADDFKTVNGKES